MKKIYLYIRWIFPLVFFLLLFVSCNKFLEEKPDKKMVIINTIRDLQGLLDDYNWVNKGSGTGEAAADNYYILERDYSIMPDDQKNLYKWNADRVFRINGSSNAWSRTYDNVYRANTVLFYLDKIERTQNDQTDWNNVKGQAHFLRAKSFLNAVTVWSVAYEKQTAVTALGIPLRLDPDFNVLSIRSTLQQTFEQIVTDLKDAVPLLPESPISLTRAGLPSAYALLARTYLYMGEYDSCYRYANLCIAKKTGLVDYNSLNVTLTYPFSALPFEKNPELLYYSSMAAPTLLNSSNAKIDSILYQLYDTNDLRKQVFYKSNGNSTFFYRGSYLEALLFDGLSTPEVYFMLAECAARKGETASALMALNTVLTKRWKAGTFLPFNTTDNQQALEWVLAERRKELVFRDLRWMDLKRLNREGAGILLKRKIGTDEFMLLPNDLRYAMAIPEDIILMTGMPQNPR